ncbi:MAG: (2Fe-2S)-binding protein [Ignavibacteriae bacterium HGW-Ignavibacteriae-2]|jgi:aerobic-type carbon monoxide dehydrogenase small subunit (CoxS/CutS family)|nr:MAG: (2Fe-2S)-binding protein [Ignavibacteriae bacterium HGW-Ignavibacteriae-2]
MEDKNKKKGLSRRDFLKRTGTGVAGSYIILSDINEAKSTSSSEKETLKTFSSYAQNISITVNGQDYSFMVEPNTTLAELLRDELKLTGTKVVCNHGECGGCTVLMNTKAVYSCQMLAMDADGKDIITIEGLLKGEELHPLQEAFVEQDGMQCGFCTPGQIMSAYALLLNNPQPNKQEILKGMSGNICRCSAYPNIVKSVEEAARKMNK